MEKDRKSYKILIIEDNLADFVLIQDFLEEQILYPEILRAKNYKEAVKVLAENLSEIHIILLDLSLPDKSGEDLISGILSQTQDLPVIVLTGYSDISFGLKSLEMGVSDYLLKDELNTTTLYKSIIYNLERKRILNNLRESEKRYSELFQLSPIPKWVYNKNTFEFLEVNEAAINKFGYNYEEFLSMKRQDLLHDTDSGGLKISDKNLTLKSFVFRKKNGEIIKGNADRNDIYYKGIEAKVEVIHDVTENHRYIKAIEKQNKKLKRISWKQSHIVRAPLVRMMGLIDVINSKNVTELEKEELLQHVLSSAHEFDKTIKEIVSQAEQVNSM